MGEVDGGTDRGTARDGGVEQPGMRRTSNQDGARVWHRGGGRVRCLRQMALRSCIGEEERFFIDTEAEGGCALKQASGVRVITPLQNTGDHNNIVTDGEVPLLESTVLFFLQYLYTTLIHSCLLIPSSHT
jgi:hypothetical protein